MATYKDIQNHVKDSHGFKPKSCWIAHCKELNGLSPSKALNRQGASRMVPCPADKRPAIEEAFRHFGMID
jgi:hypothetical protein